MKCTEVLTLPVQVPRLHSILSPVPKVPYSSDREAVIPSADPTVWGRQFSDGAGGDEWIVREFALKIAGLPRIPILTGDASS